MCSVGCLNYVWLQVTFRDSTPIKNHTYCMTIPVKFTVPSDE